jgi:hypothetical protein
MLLYNLDCLCNGILLLMGIATTFAVIAYSINSRLPDDDPKKRNFHPAAVVLAPITFPIVLVLYTSFFILRVLTYGVFLILFILALIFIPHSPAPVWLEKIITSTGNRLLEVNTLLVQFFLRPWANESKRT